MNHPNVETMLAAIRFAGLPEPQIGTDPESELFFHETDHRVAYTLGYQFQVFWNGTHAEGLIGGLFRDGARLYAAADTVRKMADIVSFLDRTR